MWRQLRLVALAAAFTRKLTTRPAKLRWQVGKRIIEDSRFVSQDSTFMSPTNWHRFDPPQPKVRHVLLDEFAVGCHYVAHIDAPADPRKHLCGATRRCSTFVPRRLKLYVAKPNLHFAHQLIALY